MRVESWCVVVCDEGSKVESGETLGGVCCGMVVSNISDRRRVEKVRFASSARCRVSELPEYVGDTHPTNFSGNEARREVCASSASKGLLGSLHRGAS